MISNSKLKPCPFCGDSVNIMYNSLANTFYVYHDHITCLEECKFNAFEIDGYFAKSLSDAYDIWNTRSAN
jgi:hypothetical protein